MRLRVAREVTRWRDLVTNVREKAAGWNMVGGSFLVNGCRE